MPLRKPATVAIVDNDASVRRALLRLLNAAGLSGKTFESGDEFISTLPYSHYDCLILDLHMLGLNGFDVQGKCTQAGVQFPTIIITAHDDPGVRWQCLSAGAVAYFCKPVDGSELLQAIEHVIQ